MATVTLTLTEEQTALYDEGGWQSRRIEETCLEVLERDGIHTPTVVRSTSGQPLFCIVEGVIA